MKAYKIVTKNRESIIANFYKNTEGEERKYCLHLIRILRNKKFIKKYKVGEVVTGSRKFPIMCFENEEYAKRFMLYNLSISKDVVTGLKIIEVDGSKPILIIGIARGITDIYRKIIHGSDCYAIPPDGTICFEKVEVLT